MTWGFQAVNRLTTLINNAITNLTTIINNLSAHVDVVGAKAYASVGINGGVNIQQSYNIDSIIGGIPQVEGAGLRRDFTVTLTNPVSSFDRPILFGYKILAGDHPNGSTVRLYDQPDASTFIIRAAWDNLGDFDSIYFAIF